MVKTGYRDLLLKLISFFKANQVELQASGVYPGSRPLVKCSQGTIFVKFVIFQCLTSNQCPGALRFNNGLKSELGGGMRGGSGPGTGRLHPWKVTLAADPEPLQEACCQAALGKRNFFPAGRSAG